MKKSNVFKKCIFIALLTIVLLLVVFIMVRYDVEGEKELPFSVKKMLIVSTVDGERIEDNINIWNIDISQVNDIYLYVEKTEKNKGEHLKSVTLENFQIDRAPKKGNVKIYRPTGELSNLYQYSEQDYLEDSITYIGEKIDDLKSLEVSSAGGMIGMRIALEDVGIFISNEGQEISYDGTLLKNINVSKEEIDSNISFDIIIETNENVKFKGRMELQLPVGNIAEEGNCNLEMTDFSDVIFKRI